MRLAASRPHQPQGRLRPNAAARMPPRVFCGLCGNPHRRVPSRGMSWLLHWRQHWSLFAGCKACLHIKLWSLASVSHLPRVTFDDASSARMDDEDVSARRRMRYDLAAVAAPLGTATRAVCPAPAMRVCGAGYAGSWRGLSWWVRGKARPTCILSFDCQINHQVPGSVFTVGKKRKKESIYYYNTTI